MRSVDLLRPGRWMLYFFSLNPQHATYRSTFVLALFGLAATLIILSFVIRMWRSRSAGTVAKKLSGSWSMMAFWFGIVAFVLTVSRLEGIQFVAMRIWWVVWWLALAVYVFVQFRRFRLKHYEVLPSFRADDPREKYLPGKQKK